MNKKAMYSADIKWYDDAVYNAVTALAEKHSNAIPIFSWALGAYNCISSDSPDFESFVKYLPYVVSNAKHYKWHEGAIGALRTFCCLCSIDPMLIEAYIGMTFQELCEVDA